MSLETALLIAQLGRIVDWQKVAGRRSASTSLDSRALEKAIERALHRFSTEFPDSEVALDLFNTRLSQEALIRSLFEHLAEPITVELIHDELVAIFPDHRPDRSLELEITAFLEILRQELLKTPQFRELYDVLVLQKGQDALNRMADSLDALKKMLDSDVGIESVGVDFKPPNVLLVKMELPELITTDGYFDTVGDKLWSVEFIYLIFALIGSEESSDRKALQDLVRILRPLENRTERKLSKPEVRMLVEFSTVEPLRILAAHYGSPASFDLLGIGKVLEVLRDVIKDLAWRGKHEKQIAEHERTMARLQEQSKEVEIEKLRLESEKVKIDIGAQAMDILEKASKLKLSDDDREVIIHALLPHFEAITNPPPFEYLPRPSRPVKTELLPVVATQPPLPYTQTPPPTSDRPYTPQSSG